ncbi:MAG TPA: MlaD family protein [Solirubrobacterales bacterium]|jgi:phospholipid/cholesterol/gamma-HCH transport system substrate-binding protein|nr:MlaD family protein [Solirubrobacterales bacterium]
MSVAIRKHLRDFIAIALLLVVGLASAYVIVQNQRLRIPLIEERPFELKAEFQTAQAVVPGQGQTLRVAGVKVGDVEDVSLEDGVAVVTFGVDRDFLPVYRDATILLRPQTGLKDMFFEMDPGTKKAGEIQEGGTVQLANTAPDVNLDEVLGALDNDTRAYLRLLLVSGGQALHGRDKDLGRLLGSLGPLSRDIDRINSKVAERKANLRRLITNFNLLTREVGRSEQSLTDLVEASNTSISAIAEQDPSVQRAVRLLPGTLAQSTVALNHISQFADQLGPALGDLRPFARNLAEVNSSTKRLAVKTTPVIKSEIRPFVRTARGPVRDLGKASSRLAKATPKLTVVAKKINGLGNMAAYNPNGAEPPDTPRRDEGYLYWAAWLGHNSNSVFQVQDAHGVDRRIYLTIGCDEAMSLLGASPLAPAVTGLQQLFAPGAPFAGGC